MQHSMTGRGFAALAVLAAAAALPPLGQQTQIRQRRNAPGEVLAPPPRVVKQKRRQIDVDRMDAAEAKRQRKNLNRITCAQAGGFIGCRSEVARWPT